MDLFTCAQASQNWRQEVFAFGRSQVDSVSIVIGNDESRVLFFRYRIENCPLDVAHLSISSSFLPFDDAYHLTNENGSRMYHRRMITEHTFPQIQLLELITSNSPSGICGKCGHQVRAGTDDECNLVAAQCKRECIQTPWRRTLKRFIGI